MARETLVPAATLTVCARRKLVSSRSSNPPSPVPSGPTYPDEGRSSLRSKLRESAVEGKKNQHIERLVTRFKVAQRELPARALSTDEKVTHAAVGSPPGRTLRK